MANKSKRTGTEGENYIRDMYVKQVWPFAERDRSNRPSSDYLGTEPIPVEAKRQATLLIPAWTRELDKRHGPEWVLFAVPRDRRKKDAHPDLMIVNAEFGVELLQAWRFLNG
jgi:hypothetical protein